jgi:hypothetical protein
MKITKRQLRRIIKEAQSKLLKETMVPLYPINLREERPADFYPDHGLEVRIPEDDTQFSNAEEGLQTLLAALAMMPPEDAGEMARYAMDELHGYKI